jgi:putative pyruvate formate lyase activating enzyme
MQCIYCQNYQISRNRGPVIEHRLELRDVVERVERAVEDGVRTVGFVSPSHCIPQMKAIMRALVSRGTRPTFVMNTNAYDRVATIESLEGVMDVYLPDLRYLDAELAREYSDAPDYPAVATKAIKEMFRQKGAEIVVGEDGCIRSGLIIRHLVLPNRVEHSKRCLRWIAGELSPSVHVSLMAQYSPTPPVADHPSLGRRLRPEEYEEVVEELERLGIARGWTQELTSPPSASPGGTSPDGIGSSTYTYAPDFARAHPFERQGE